MAQLFPDKPLANRQRETAPLPNLLPSTARLRRNRFAGWLAVLLLLFQAAAAAEHLSAAAAATGQSPGASGILGLCSGRGIAPESGDPVQAPDRSKTAALCAFCASHSATGSAVFAATIATPAANVRPLRAAPRPPHAGHLPAPTSRHGTVRGPPRPFGV